MKILRTIFYILLAVILVLVLLAFAGPKSYDISRTVAIDAPPELVFPYIHSLKKANAWGPWNKEDPDMQVEYEGEDGKVGAISRWQSDKVGSGKQEITSITDGTMESRLTFYAPYGESNATGYIGAMETGDGSMVTWGFRGENNFIGRIFSVFMNMEKYVGPMFVQGLDSLKAMVETDIGRDYYGYVVQVVRLPPKRYVSVRQTLAMDALGTFFGEQYGRIMAGMARANAVMDGPPSGLYYSWDEENGMTDVAAAIPVGADISIPETELISLSEGHALLLNYHGPYSKLAEGHAALDAFMQETGVKVKIPVIEEYITDPQSEPDTTRWLTKIFYLLDQ